MVKEAIFSILESYDLQGQISKKDSLFVDLFAGSGQIGLEAISRGFQKCIMYEVSKERFSHLANNLSEYNESITLYNKDAFRLSLSNQTEAFETVVYFLDPPYSFWESKEHEIYNLVENIFEAGLNQKIVIIQSPRKVEWKDFQIKSYGNTHLLIHAN